MNANLVPLPGGPGCNFLPAGRSLPAGRFSDSQAVFNFSGTPSQVNRGPRLSAIVACQQGLPSAEPRSRGEPREVESVTLLANPLPYRDESWVSCGGARAVW